MLPPKGHFIAAVSQNFCGYVKQIFIVVHVALLAQPLRDINTPGICTPKIFSTIRTQCVVVSVLFVASELPFMEPSPCPQTRNSCSPCGMKQARLRGAEVSALGALRQLCLWAWLLAFAPLPVGAQLPVPPLVGHVTDQTGTFTAEQQGTLEQTLAAYEARKSTQLAVLLVPTTAPEEIEQYALRVAELWKPGRKKVDDGLVVVVAKNDRAVRIEVGGGLMRGGPGGMLGGGRGGAGSGGFGGGASGRW
jgi:hypothetical protein